MTQVQVKQTCEIFIVPISSFLVTSQSAKLSRGPGKSEHTCLHFGICTALSKKTADQHCSLGIKPKGDICETRE